MGNLNWRRAIGAARAAVATMAACLSRAARKRFTAEGYAFRQQIHGFMD
jgi:hypothetical protein